MADEKSDQQPAEQKTYTITYADNKTLEAQAESVAWTENGEFILLMDGEVTKHVIVASNVVAVTQR
jgi:hypothetical protein